MFDPAASLVGGELAAPQARSMDIPPLEALYGPVAHDIERANAILQEELASDQAAVTDLCAHVGAYHGKQIRPAIVLLTGAALGRLAPAHHTLAAVVELVHLATLVHDDILDEADVRRRTPTINRLHGNERAVLFGDYLFSHAYHLCSGLETQFAARLIARTAATLCEGEMMQVTNRENYDLTEERYYDIIGRKTAALIAACGVLGAKYAQADEGVCRAMHAYGRSLGIAFQIVDDLLDIAGDERQVGKSLGRDVEKGKPTLPLIHFLQTQGVQRREELLDLLHGDAPDRPQRVAAILRKSDSLAYAEESARRQVDEALGSLEALPRGAARDCLRMMAEFVVARRY